MNDKPWFDADGNSFTDQQTIDWLLEKEICKHLTPYELSVGTDSHLNKNKIRFVQVICVYHPGYGGNYRYTITYKDKLQYKGKQQVRMLQEAEFSIGLAEWIVDNTGIIPSIHIDASVKTAGHFTSAFSDQLKGLVIGSGFECCLKPESPTAACVADHHTR